MKERRVGTHVLILIVIVVAAVSVGSYFILKSEEVGPDGLPLYPESESYDIPEEYFQELGKPLEEVEIKGYIARASVQDILDWYSDHMTHWEMVEERIDTSTGTTIGAQLYGQQPYEEFIKGAGVVAVSGAGKVDKTIYILLTGPLPTTYWSWVKLRTGIKLTIQAR